MKVNYINEDRYFPNLKGRDKKDVSQTLAKAANSAIVNHLLNNFSPTDIMPALKSILDIVFDEKTKVFEFTHSLWVEIGGTGSHANREKYDNMIQRYARNIDFYKYYYLFLPPAKCNKSMIDISSTFPAMSDTMQSIIDDPEFKRSMTIDEFPIILEGWYSIIQKNTSYVDFNYYYLPTINEKFVAYFINCISKDFPTICKILNNKENKDVVNHLAFDSRLAYLTFNYIYQNYDHSVFSKYPRIEKALNGGNEIDSLLIGDVKRVLSNMVRNKKILTELFLNIKGMKENIQTDLDVLSNYIANTYNIPIKVNFYIIDNIPSTFDADTAKSDVYVIMNSYSMPSEIK